MTCAVGTAASLLALSAISRLAAEDSNPVIKQPTTETQPNAVETPKEKSVLAPEPSIEIILADSVHFNVTDLQISDTEITFKRGSTSKTETLPVTDVRLARYPNGRYKFFSANAITGKSAKAPSAKTGMMLLAGSKLQYSKNTDLGDYNKGFANYLASSLNKSSNPKGYTGAVVNDAPALALGFDAEMRFIGERFMLGFQGGYTPLSEISARVSSPYNTTSFTITYDTTFIPLFAILYYRLPLKSNFFVNLGIGAGAMYTRVKIGFSDGATSQTENYSSWNAALTFRPEIGCAFGRIHIILGLPMYWAESQKVEHQGDALINGDSGKVVSANLTGIGLSLAVGYQLF